MKFGPPTLPEPGSQAYQTLSADEQLWLSIIDDWYSHAMVGSAVRRALRHPMVETFRQQPELHWPKLVRFYGDNPRLFNVVLVELLGVDTDAPTVEERRTFWATTVERALAERKKIQAAE